jgi:hypothetical protein
MVENRHRPREVGEEDDARLERRDQERLTARVVVGEGGPQLTDTDGDLLGR